MACQRRRNPMPNLTGDRSVLRFRSTLDCGSQVSIDRDGNLLATFLWLHHGLNPIFQAGRCGA